MLNIILAIVFLNISLFMNGLGKCLHIFNKYKVTYSFQQVIADVLFKINSLAWSVPAYSLEWRLYGFFFQSSKLIEVLVVWI